MREIRERSVEPPFPPPEARLWIAEQVGKQIADHCGTYEGATSNGLKLVKLENGTESVCCVVPRAQFLFDFLRAEVISGDAKSGYRLRVTGTLPQYCAVNELHMIPEVECTVKPPHALLPSEAPSMMTKGATIAMAIVATALLAAAIMQNGNYDIPKIIEKKEIEDKRIEIRGSVLKLLNDSVATQQQQQ